jgi:hypothetical protein
MLLSNESKKLVSPFAWNAIAQDIIANFVVSSAEGQILDKKILV